MNEEIINTYTSLIPLITIKESNSLYLNASIISYVCISSIFHLLPKDLQALRFLVDICLSNLLYSMLNSSCAFGIGLSLVILLSLEINKDKEFSQFVRAIYFEILELLLIYKIFFTNKNQAFAILICKLLSFVDKKIQWNAENKSDFSFFHAAEHLEYYLIIKFFTKSFFRISECFVILICLTIFLAIFIYCYNFYIYSSFMSRVPSWVKNDQALVNVLKNKIQKNYSSKKISNYILKPYLYSLKLHIVTWAEIEKHCDSVLTKLSPDDIDVVIGIQTGGYFIGKYVAMKLNKPLFAVKSQLWSGSTMMNNFEKGFNHYFSKNSLAPKISEIPETLDVSGKRILICDDSICTGTTISNIINRLKAFYKPKEVKSFSIWVYGKFNPDYFHTYMRVPLLWEWGAEID